MAKTKQWAALTAVLVLLILAAGWFLLVSPKRSATTALNATAAKQEQDNATVRTQIAALKAQALDLPKKQARLTEISARMPDNPALPSLIRALSDAADKAKVDLMSLSPSAPVALTAAVPATVGLATPPVAVQQIPLALTVQGKFFQMEQFLSNLESLPRAFVVTTLGVAPAGGSGPAAAGAAGRIADGHSFGDGLHGPRDDGGHAGAGCRYRARGDDRNGTHHVTPEPVRGSRRCRTHPFRSSRASRTTRSAPSRASRSSRLRTVGGWR